MAARPRAPNPLRTVDPSRSRPTYDEELAALAAVYAAARGNDFTRPLLELLESIGDGPTVYVGSGGAVPVARLAAEVHLHRTGALAVATTPIGLVGMSYPRNAAAVVISSRAAHPDVSLALDAARRALADPVVLLTHRDPNELAPLSRLTHAVVRLPPVGPRDGFLATTSVLAMATAFGHAAGDDLPAHLPGLLAAPPSAPIAERTLVLFGPRTTVPALDLETRLSELGLSPVQVVDYRNFAHGRHLGFSRHLSQTLVVALSDTDDKSLADATLALLPPDATIVRLTSPLRWPASALDLLVRSMTLVGALAAGRSLDPAQPVVPGFGRRLYHLATRRRLSVATPGPIERKLVALGRPGSPELHHSYRRALDDWLDAFATVPLGGIVVDYDGTVCATSDRYQLPASDIQAALLRLLDGGLVIGVASGRGRSLVRDLRAWVPRVLWGRIEIGLYNGSLTGSLDAELALPAEPVPHIEAFVARLADHPITAGLSARIRPTQVSIELGTHGAEMVGRVIGDLISRAPALELRPVRSGHSLDVVASGSKRLVVETVALRADGAVLAIGDQGQLGGNDHDLLAASPWSLSVDRCSADPSRCWNLLPFDAPGPSGLERYLRALQVRHSVARFRWRHAR